MKQQKFYVHRVVAEAFFTNFEKGKGIDHIDGDPTNNNLWNLRTATQTVNMQGFQKKRTGTCSKYRGVTYHLKAKKWMGQIRVSGQQMYLGLFHNEEDAAKAYDLAATRFGFHPTALNFN